MGNLIKCKRIIEYERCGTFDYHTCNKKAKYKIKYLTSTTGKQKTEFICGVHFNAVKKVNDRLFKKRRI